MLFIFMNEIASTYTRTRTHTSRAAVLVLVYDSFLPPPSDTSLSVSFLVSNFFFTSFKKWSLRTNDFILFDLFTHLNELNFFFFFWRNNFLTIPVITARRVVKNKIVNLSKIYSCQCIKVGFSLSSLSVSTSILGECRISSAKNFS